MSKFTKISNEPSLIDSNILVFSHNIASPFQERAKELLFLVLNGEIKGVLSPQNLLEFYSVITNPKRVEKPLLIADVSFLVDEYLTSGDISFIYPKEGTSSRAFSLARKYQIRKADIFDTYLIATMLDNDVKIIYTDNDKHFRIFEEIKVINPFKP